MQIERSVRVDIKKLYPNPWNPNRRSYRQGKSLKESIEKFGQFAEILVRNHPEKEGEYQILDGEHRYKDLIETGESDVFVNIIEASDFDARKLTLIANDGGENDQESLSKLIAELSDACDGDLNELTFALSLDYEDISALLQFGEEEDIPPLPANSPNDCSELLGSAAKQVEDARGVAMRGLQVPFSMQDYDRAYELTKEAHKLGLSVGAIFVQAVDLAIKDEKKLKGI